MRCAALPPAQLPGSNCRRPEPLRICPKASSPATGKPAPAKEEAFARAGEQAFRMKECPWRYRPLVRHGSASLGPCQLLRLSGLTCRRPGVWPAYAHLSKSVQSGGWKAGACEGGTIRPRGQPSLRKRECPWRYRPSALGRARHRRGRHSAAWPVTGLGAPEDFMRKPRSSWSKGATGYSPEKQASQYCGQALLRPLASPTAR